MKTLRLVHLYLGIFLAPSILFFALTGAMQTFSLHESERGNSYQPPAWIARLAQIHKKQSIQAPPQRTAQPTPSKADTAKNDAPKPPGPAPRRLKVSWPLKWFFLFVSLGLATTTALGIWMSFQMRRSPALLWGLLLAGLLVPIGLAFL